MSEDVKPRQFWTQKGTPALIADSCSYHEAKGFCYGDRCELPVIKVIELEPTLQLMKEMAESFQEWLDDTEEDFNEQPGWKSCKESLEKYKKFKDGLK